jgi:general stress protein 26
MHEEIIKRAGEVIGGGGAECFCALALIDEDGFPSASTVSISKHDGIKWLTFCVHADDNKANRARKNNRASVCVNSLEYNVTLVGTVEILTDTETKKEMWYKGLEQHWSGPEDEKLCILRFKTIRYSLFVDWKDAKGKL